jgi:hypothetical protein
MKMCGGEDVYIHLFLTSTLDWSEWSPSRPSRSTAVKGHPVRWIGLWKDSRHFLDVFRNRSLSLPYEDSKLETARYVRKHLLYDCEFREYRLKGILHLGV